MLRELEMMFGLVIGTIGAVVCLAVIFLGRAAKNNDKLRDNVKDAARSVGTSAGMKIAEWILGVKK